MLDIFVSPYSGKKSIIYRTPKAATPPRQVEDIVTTTSSDTQEVWNFANPTYIFKSSFDFLIKGVQAFGLFCSAVPYKIKDMCCTQQTRDIGVKCGLVNRVEEYSDWSEDKQKEVRTSITTFVKNEKIAAILCGSKHSDAVKKLQNIKFALYETSTNFPNRVDEAIEFFVISDRNWKDNMGDLVPLVKYIKNNCDNLDLLLSFDDNRLIEPVENGSTTGENFVGEASDGGIQETV